MKNIPSKLAATLKEVINVVNYIKANPLRSIVLVSFCEEMDSNYIIVYYTEIYWLSKEKVIHRFVYMATEIISFIDTEKLNFKFMHNNH